MNDPTSDPADAPVPAAPAGPDAGLPGRPPLPRHLAIGRAAASGLLLAMPAALANVALADQTPKPRGALNLTLLVMAAGFALAGYVAGLEIEDEPPKRGALVALIAFALVQAVGILGRLDRGDPIRPVGIVLLGLFAACLGSGGALLFGAASRARKRRKAS